MVIEAGVYNKGRASMLSVMGCVKSVASDVILAST